MCKATLYTIKEPSSNGTFVLPQQKRIANALRKLIHWEFDQFDFNNPSSKSMPPQRALDWTLQLPMGQHVIPLDQIKPIYYSYLPQERIDMIMEYIDERLDKRLGKWEAMCEEQRRINLAPMDHPPTGEWKQWDGEKIWSDEEEYEYLEANAAAYASRRKQPLEHQPRKDQQEPRRMRPRRNAMRLSWPKDGNTTVQKKGQ